MPYDQLQKEAFIQKFRQNLGLLRTIGQSMRSAVRLPIEKVPPAPEYIPKAFTRGLEPGVDVERAWRGYRHQGMQGNDESLILWPFRSIAEKLIGGHKGIKKVRGNAWKHVGSKALLADMYAGNVLRKIPLVGKSLFNLTEDIPWGKGLKKQVTRASALAPLAKARDIAEPIVIGVGLEKGIHALSDMSKQRHMDKQGQDMSFKDKVLREKVASVMLSLHERNKGHEKRAHALRVLYKQAELGHAPLPQTYSELEVKLAALANEDLVVLEKALELAGGNIKLGEIGKDETKLELGPAEKFQATILGEEF